jgi:hypothetical protein
MTKYCIGAVLFLFLSFLLWMNESLGIASRDDDSEAPAALSPARLSDGLCRRSARADFYLEKENG